MMSPDQWREVEMCYHSALGREPVSRAAYLAQLEPAIRSEVEELLSQESQDSPLDHRSGLFESLTPGAMLAHYRIDQSIGAGGMGDVYRATDTKLHRNVAIKVCGAGFVRRFEREARAIAALNHPNICTLYESGPDYLVMELVEGPTLAERIRKGAIPLNEAIDIARQIAEALEAAHEQGIIHRDLKPANIKITPDGRAKVLDFGLAKSTTRSSPNDATLTNTEQGLIVGTPSYMSPEQAEGLPAGKHTDIWSFGVVFWEMLTGHRLFDAQSASRILSEVLQREIDFDKLPATIPDHIRTLLRRCLDRDVKTRLRDIGEARVALIRPLTGQPRKAPRISAITLAWTATAAALLAMIALVATLAWHWSTRPSPASTQRVQFQFPSPEPAVEDLNLSPDGRTLLIVGGAGTTTRKLWLRSLDSLEARLLTSLEGMQSYTFWSPDSRFICYLMGSRLYRISRDGGSAPVLMAEVPASTSSAMWHDDGVIVLGSRDGMYRMSVAGGALTKLYKEGSFFPTALPNGRFTFTRPDGIYVGALSGGRPPVRIAGDRVYFHHMYVPPLSRGQAGYLFLFRDGTLFAQSFDPGKLEFQGVPIPLADLPGGPAMYAASPTGALVTTVDSTAHNLTWFDRSGRMIRRATPDLRLRNPIFRLSSDDSRALAVIRNPDNGKYDLWVAGLDNGALSRFTFSGATSGIWSPDSRQILWATQGGSRFVRPSDGSGSDNLMFQDPASGFLMDWSTTAGSAPAIALSRMSDQARAEIWTTPAAGGAGKLTPFLQADFSAYDAQFSSDGRWIAYSSKYGAQPPQVVVESVPRGSGRWQVSIEGGDCPIWRRDGRELYFRQGGKLMAAPVRPANPATLEFGRPQPLFDLPPASRFQAARDGQRFLVALPAQKQGPTDRLITVDTDWRAGLPSK